jgi:hypothetical protein
MSASDGVDAFVRFMNTLKAPDGWPVVCGKEENGDVWIKRSDMERFVFKGTKCSRLIPNYARNTTQEHSYYEPVYVEIQRPVEEWIAK